MSLSGCRNFRVSVAVADGHVHNRNGNAGDDREKEDNHDAGDDDHEKQDNHDF